MTWPPVPCVLTEIIPPVRTITAWPDTVVAMVPLDAQTAAAPMMTNIATSAIHALEEARRRSGPADRAWIASLERPFGIMSRRYRAPLSPPVVRSQLQFIGIGVNPFRTGSWNPSA